MVGSPQHTFNTTFAVLRPTPGSFSKSARLCGTLPSWSSINICESLIMFLALVLKRPMVFMCFFKPASPSLSIFSGASTFLNKSWVALFTPLSVDWAESTTATTSVNGFFHSSSLLGSGSAFLRRVKNSITFAFFMVATLKPRSDKSKNRVGNAPIWAMLNGMAIDHLL